MRKYEKWAKRGESLLKAEKHNIYCSIVLKNVVCDKGLRKKWNLRLLLTLSPKQRKVCCPTSHLESMYTIKHYCICAKKLERFCIRMIFFRYKKGPSFCHEKTSWKMTSRPENYKSKNVLKSKTPENVTPANSRGMCWKNCSQRNLDE